ncbi:MAG: hypothetical protein JSV86_00765 [Gemmatimonadota bacterium]|nr:MAG: hypothetical protein JSV86_00765 [Gemmatimonadota bacterium]
MASGEPRRSTRRPARRPGVRERWEAMPADEQASLEAMTDALFDRVLGPAWEQLGPLGAGAVASSVAIVGARGLLRRVFGRRYGRLVSWVGAVALVPVALWLLSGNAKGEGSEEPGVAEESDLPGTSGD